MYIYNFHTCDTTYLYGNSQLVREIKLRFGKRIWTGACVHVADERIYMQKRRF